MRCGPPGRAGWQAHTALDSFASIPPRGQRIAVSERDFLVLVNGETRAVHPDCTIARLVGSLGLEDRRIAVAVNRDVIPRSAFDSHRLANGDRVEILEAVGGG
ncbi:MAG: sulfur carrier protein ThiS [Deltaproteobacteria bacterium]|nr:MAG: sulfur carrier protein ThiS [Deltaproteobacteria bacterium]